MKTRIILFTFLLSLGLCMKGQPVSMAVVRSFGENMQSWIQTGKLAFHKNLIRLSNGEKKVRVYDELSSYLFNKYNYVGANELNSYLNCLEKEMSNGITIKYSDFRWVSPNDISVIDAKGLEFIACDVMVTGAFSHHSKDIFYIRNGKISKIDKYEIVQDARTGRKKVKVDLSDIVYDHNETIGFGYNYSKHFPVGASIFYAWESFPVLLSFDFGYNMDDDKYVVDNVKMTDVMNYNRTKKIYDPKYYMIVTPHAYFRYFAVGCGVGCLVMNCKEETANYYYNNVATGVKSGGYSTETEHAAFKFMIRPSVKGFIPLDGEDKWAIVASVGYNWAFGCKEKNGLNMGLGLKVNVDW